MKALLNNSTHPPSLETPGNLQQRRRRTKSDSFDTRVLCLHYYSNALGLDFGDEGDVYRVDQIEEWGAADRKEVAGRHRGVEQMSDEQGSQSDYGRWRSNFSVLGFSCVWRWTAHCERGERKLMKKFVSSPLVYWCFVGVGETKSRPPN